MYQTLHRPLYHNLYPQLFSDHFYQTWTTCLSELGKEISKQHWQVLLNESVKRCRWGIVFSTENLAINHLIMFDINMLSYLFRTPVIFHLTTCNNYHYIPTDLLAIADMKASLCLGTTSKPIKTHLKHCQSVSDQNNHTSCLSSPLQINTVILSCIKSAYIYMYKGCTWSMRTKQVGCR